MDVGNYAGNAVRVKLDIFRVVDVLAGRKVIIVYLTSRVHVAQALKIVETFCLVALFHITVIGVDRVVMGVKVHRRIRSRAVLSMVRRIMAVRDLRNTEIRRATKALNELTRVQTNGGAGTVDEQKRRL